MRLGKIKNILNQVVAENGTITISAEPVYGGQAHQVNNFATLINGLKLLNDQEWNELGFEHVQTLIDKYKLQQTQIITNEEYNGLNSYVTSINQKLPIFLGLINTMVDDQDEQAINIKLPKNPEGLKELNSLNTKLDKLFTKFNIDGQPIEFKGFDTGSDWYVFVVSGAVTYRAIIGCIKIANDYFVMKENYYKSNRAKLDYKASLAKQEEFDEKQLEKFQQRRLHLELEEKVNELAAKIEERNGHEPAEMSVKLIKATEDLIEVLGDGVEFHLSLNPPKYANEGQNGELTIDYSKMPKLEKKKEIKAIESTKPKEAKEKDDE